MTNPGTETANVALRGTLNQWYRENQMGGWRTRWRRRPVWAAQVVQKLGLHREVAAPLFFGGTMRVVTGERVSRCLLTFGYSECALSALLLGLLREGDGMIDVGAHFGYEALLAAHLVGRTGAVYSFEPNPAAHRLAHANLSSRDQCRLFQMGVGDAPGTLRMRPTHIVDSAFATIGFDDAAGSVEVPMTTIDAALDAVAPIRVFKCDAEGFEVHVLKGARETIARHRPVLLLEVGMRDDLGAVAARTRELGECLGPSYEPFDFEYDGRLTIGPAGALRPGHANVAFVPEERRDEFLALADRIP